MRAVGLRAFGGPEVLEVLTLEAPKPGEGQALVKVQLAGVNAIDVHVRRGSFLGSTATATTLPKVLGYEGAGTIEAVGPGVAGLKPGDRVAWCGTPGAHAELAVVPAWRLVPVPDAMPLDIACALQLDGMMAHALSISVFPIKDGDVVLIQSAAEPLSLLLIQVAKGMGARVIATVPREADAGGPKAAGADAVIVLAAGDGAARIREATGNQGCHVVYDSLGRDSIASSLACCRRRGVVALVAGSSPPVETVRPEELAAAGSLFLTRPHLADFLQDATEVRWRMGDLITAWSEGQLKVGVGRILPLDGAREAHLAIEAGTSTGKILLKV